ncbi:ATP-binding protein [Rhizobium leguminosarum]|uniref:ATP-binding protein n=1 Tax=Rhizobium leguminosarum TaxID=384 RepID=UPI003ECE3EBF
MACRLSELGLYSVAAAFQELNEQPERAASSMEMALSCCFERKTTMRRQKRLEARARAAKLLHEAQIENPDFRAARGLDYILFMAFAGRDLLVTGPAGVELFEVACDGALPIPRSARKNFCVYQH